MRSRARTLTPELSQSELGCLLDLLRKACFRGKHLEIGTAAGGTLCCMMKVFDDHERPPFVVVDPMTYFSDQLATVEQNLRKNGISPEDVDFRIQKSHEAFLEADQRGELFDFIFIDGAHKIHYVTDDLRWTRLLRKGGLVCLHDYRSVRGVTLAVDRFLGKNPQYEKIDHVDTLLVLRKTEEGPRQEISSTDRIWAFVLAPVLRLEVFLKKRFPRSGR